MNSDEFVFFSFYRRKHRFSAQISILSRKMSGKTGKLCGKLGDFGGNTWNIIGSNKQDERL